MITQVYFRTKKVCKVYTCCLVTQSCPTLLWPPWTVAHQASLSMNFSRQYYLLGLPFPSPGNLPDPGIEPTSPALVGGFFTTDPPGKLQGLYWNILIISNKALSSINLFISWIARITLKVSGFYLVCIFIVKEEFIEAGSYLKGYVTTGIYSEEDVLRL